MNLGLLDNFVCEYLFDRGYLTKSNSVGTRALNSNKKQVELLQNIKTSLLEGDIEAVLSQLSSLDHLLLEKNKALLFSLQLHHFKEILCKQGSEEALIFLREVLVHLALISTSTSYEEFKSQMTLLLYDEETLNETLPKERQELVSSVHTPLLKSLQIEETLFTNILAYLVYIHNYKHVMTGTTTEYPEIEQILLGERTHVDPGEIIRFREQQPERFQEISNNLQENDVRLLCDSVHINREQALQSLILSNNDLQSAFRREIKRIQLNHKFLSKLCLQYAQFRGLIQKNKNSKPNENQKEKKNIEIEKEEEKGEEEKKKEEEEKEKEKGEEEEKINQKEKEKENERIRERLKQIRLFLEQPTNLEENIEEETIENINENVNEKEKEKEKEKEVEEENEKEKEIEEGKQNKKKKYYRSDELKEIYCEIENMNKEFWEKNHDLYFEFNIILILELIKEKKNEVAIELIKEISKKHISNKKKQEKCIKQLMLIAVLYDHTFDYKKENNSNLRDCIIDIQQSINYKKIALNIFNQLTESIDVEKSTFQQMVQYLIKTFHVATETNLSSNRFIKVLRLDELSKPDSSNEQKTNSNEDKNQNQNMDENVNNDNNNNDNEIPNEPEQQPLTHEGRMIQQMMDMMSMTREDATTVLVDNGFDINLAINSLFN
ncbi:ran-binding protein in the microtubule-organising centre protein [Anaeramoeba flamelloides]|uniref:Ran-binding protein in the microtubule-organising centre protein n=1 Tax=Anaeramoeba flamelloides TaxID=1746091 RepID=A0AAV7ZSS4_9EUKA|nr:ran-binding protein in the microtubule-organising centre protein [Anaeramoeba flamelloides]